MIVLKNDDALVSVPTLTKAQLADLLFDQLGLSKRESKNIVDVFFSLIAQGLISSQDIKLSGFGNFCLKKKSLRLGRNPKTGDSFSIDARCVVTFHASNKLKEIVH